MGNLKVMTNAVAANPRKRFAESTKVLTSWFQKWNHAFPSHGVTELQIAVYLEALDDLSPEQIDRGCREATRAAEQLPKPGHIRAALLKAEAESRFTGLGPPLLAYAEISQEERDEALKFSEELKKKLGAPSPKSERPKLTVRPSLLSLKEQKRLLWEKGLLK